MPVNKVACVAHTGRQANVVCLGEASFGDWQLVIVQFAQPEQSMTQLGTAERWCYAVRNMHDKTQNRTFRAHKS